jgi:putative hydrolase of the HAD superfamily
MPIKAIVVDVDGVLVVRLNGVGWDAHLERDLGISAVDLHLQFFAVHWDDVVRGQAKLRDRLTPVLNTLAPNVTCDQLVDYWFSHDAYVDRDLLGDLSELRRRGFSVHLATVQEHERARYLWDSIGLRHQVDGMHYSAELGYVKPELAFYRRIEERIVCSSNEIFFIDDRAENVEGARSAGWNSTLWIRGTKLTKLIEAIDSVE